MHVAGIRDAAWCYPEPKTHAHVRDCVTFAVGKGIQVELHAVRNEQSISAGAGDRPPPDQMQQRNTLARVNDATPKRK